MRSSLDHAIFDLAKESSLFDYSSASLNRAIKFPICYNSNSFNSWKNGRVIRSGLTQQDRDNGLDLLLIKELYGEEIINFLDSIQPYQEEETSEGRFLFRSALKDIAALDNYAKHAHTYQIASYTVPVTRLKATEAEDVVTDVPVLALKYQKANSDGRMIAGTYTIHHYDHYVWPAITAMLSKIHNRQFTRIPMIRDVPWFAWSAES